jgi:hypothetical protein
MDQIRENQGFAPSKLVSLLWRGDAIYHIFFNRQRRTTLWQSIYRQGVDR